jgi:hypothetical protein
MTIRTTWVRYLSVAARVLTDPGTYNIDHTDTMPPVINLTKRHTRLFPFHGSSLVRLGMPPCMYVGEFTRSFHEKFY